jgi:ribose 5-phosphate isomerase A
MATLEDRPRLDLAVDGADEIQQGSLSLIKGAGGALLREKLVGIAAARLIIIADASKVMQQLGTRFAVPVEIVRFGWRGTAERLRSLGCEPVQRQDSQGRAVITDEGNYLLDCRFPPISDAATLGRSLMSVVGVIEHGLFVGMASEAIVAGPESIQVLRPE